MRAVLLWLMWLTVALAPRLIVGQAAPPAEVDSVLGALVETHGVSGMEGPVREAVPDPRARRFPAK